MSVEPIGLVFLLLGFLILKRGPIFGVCVLIPTVVLGSCAAVLVANATIQPAHLILGFTMVTLLAQPGTLSLILARMAFPKEGFWFVATAIVGIVGAFILPRLFAGATYVIAVGATASGASLVLVPLGPTTGNFTQSVYFVSDICFFLICYIIALKEQGLRIIVKAIYAYSILNIFFAFVDLATYWTGTAFLLDFMRNSTYGIQDEAVINGLKRINGSFTEASQFASSSLWVGSFCFRLWLGGIRPGLNFTLAMINMLLVVFATSTTGYVVLPVMLGIMYLTSLMHFFQGGALPKSVYAFLVMAPLLFLLLVAIVALTPALSDPIMGMIQDMVLNKGSSSSAEERGMWNHTALNAFFATYGMGAGIGTVRASSFPLAVLANLGAAGGLTYAIFILIALFKPAARKLDWDAAQIRAAARTSSLVAVIMACISGTMIDLGLTFYMLAGIACAICDNQKVAAPETSSKQTAVRRSTAGRTRMAAATASGDASQ